MKFDKYLLCIVHYTPEHTGRWLMAIDRRNKIYIISAVSNAWDEATSICRSIINKSDRIIELLESEVEMIRINI